MGSENHRITLNGGHISNLRGFIAEKIVSMRRQQINYIVLQELGNDWKAFPHKHIEDWLCLSPDDFVLASGETRNIKFSTNNPELCLQRIREAFDKKHCLFITDSVFKQISKAKSLVQPLSFFPEKDVSLPDLSFLVYRLAEEKKSIQRTFMISKTNNKKKVLREHVSTKVPAIKEVRAVCIEIKSYSDHMKIKLTKPQKKLLDKAREKGTLFYFTIRLDFDFSLSESIPLQIIKNKSSTIV